MNTLENNKLIAEFIGGKMKVENYHGINIIEIDNKTFDLNGLKYHSSWDWLMPVVEKIWSITNNRGSLFYFEVNDELTIYGKEESSMDSNKGNCYSAVVEFIKWYNKNNL